VSEEKPNSRKHDRNSSPPLCTAERAETRDLGCVSIVQDTTRVRTTKVRGEIGISDSKLSRLYTSPTTTYKYISEIENKWFFSLQ
jgi:hypothetical protein